MMRDKRYQQTRSVRTSSPISSGSGSREPLSGHSTSTSVTFGSSASLSTAAARRHPRRPDARARADAEKSWKRVRAAWRDFFKWAVGRGSAPTTPSTGSRNSARLPTRLRPLAAGRARPAGRRDPADGDAAARASPRPHDDRVRRRAAELRGIHLGDFDLYRRAVTVSAKEKAPADPDLDRTREHGRRVPAHRVPAARSVPDATDYVWFPVHNVGDRIIGLKPEEAVGYSQFL